MAEKKDKHIHKLKRYRFKSGSVVYFCALPECNYKVAIALALGKRVLCWRCGKDFVMNEYAVRLAKPHCEACHKSKGEEPVHEEVEILTLPPMSLAERLKQSVVFSKPETDTQEDDI